MNATHEISNADDVIDSRDVIARIEELKASWAEATGENPDDFQLSGDDWTAGLDEDEAAEIISLLALADEASDAADWEYGATLIRDTYFEDYARELAEDIGAISSDAGWPLCCIDWKRAARELQMDYFSVEFDGMDYWVRS